jgi:hypothetical protein
MKNTAQYNYKGFLVNYMKCKQLFLVFFYALLVNVSTTSLGMHPNLFNITPEECLVGTAGIVPCDEVIMATPVYQHATIDFSAVHQGGWVSITGIEYRKDNPETKYFTRKNLRMLDGTLQSISTHNNNDDCPTVLQIIDNQKANHEISYWCICQVQGRECIPGYDPKVTWSRDEMQKLLSMARQDDMAQTGALLQAGVEQAIYQNATASLAPMPKTMPAPPNQQMSRQRFVTFLLLGMGVGMAGYWLLSKYVSQFKYIFRQDIP